MSLLGASEDSTSFLSEFSLHWVADKCFFSSKTHHFLTIEEKKKKQQPTFRKLVCGFLQFVPHKTAHQQYSSKELAHSYKCVFKLKGYSVLLFLCCAAIMEGKYFHQATKSTLAPRKAVVTSYLLYKTVNRERSHGRVTVGSTSRAWCDSPSLLLQPVLNPGLTSTATALLSALTCPPFVRAAKCMQEPHKIHTC